MEEIFIIIENGEVTEIKTSLTDTRIIVINLDKRKKGEEPIIGYFETELKKSQFSLN